MSLGLAILLSSLFLGTVALFIATKDRWTWKKLMKGLVLWPVTIVVVLFITWYVYSLIQDRPKVEKSFWDIPLDATKGDVRFIKGEPTEKEIETWKYITRDQSNNWTSAYYINFKDDRVWGIFFHSPQEYDLQASIQGIHIGASIDEVQAKFGEPSHISVSDDELRRLYTYSRYNTVFELAKNKVASVGIYNPAVANRGVKLESKNEKQRKTKDKK